ncbi:MAG TPA: phytanoyl-CoA dioxygenase family protein [Planctomycetota bacterium]|nr:phytanoyl-CoA dioxygenase family protein [Planctomycetota bacterium]
MNPLPQTAPRTTVTEAEIAAFDRDGFHIHPEPLFDAHEVAAIRDACDRVAARRYATGVEPDCRAWEPGAPPTAVVKIDNAWKSDPTVLAAVTDARVARVAARLIGADGMRLWHDQYLRKPASGGGIVTWHQDWMFWQAIDRPRTVTSWIALDDVTVDQGPMLFIAGSHHGGLRLDLMPRDWTGGALPASPVAGDIVPVVVRAGQVTFHHANLLHGSSVNASGRDRVSIVSHLMAADCCYRPGHGHVCIERMLAQRDAPAPRERFRGPQFPWAWREQAG